MHTPLISRMTGCGWSLLVFSFCWMFISCGRHDKPAQPGPVPAQEKPKVLKEDGDEALNETTSIRKSGREDLVESIYRELVAKDAGLTDLEKRLDGLGDQRSDSTKLFNDFNWKSQQYYSSAGGHIAAIKDSVLRKRMETLIAVSDTAYAALTGKYRALLAHIDSRQLTVADLHEVLKLTRTLPVIERYQKQQLPSADPLKHIAEMYEGTVQQEDRLIKK